MKTLLTIGFVVDVQDFAELASLTQTIEDSMSASMRDALEAHGAALEDVVDAFEFYGVAATPIRERLS